MAALYVPEDSFFAELANVWRMFAPDRNVARSDNVPREADIGLAVYPGVPSGGHTVAELYSNGTFLGAISDGARFLPLRRGTADVRRGRLHQAKRALYRLLSDYFGLGSPWGALTGIRPTKLFRELSDRHTTELAAQEFQHAYLVRPDRIALAEQIVDVQRPYISETPTAVVYAGIPFCPSRCSYCSFISQDEKASHAARAQYLDSLLRELKESWHVAAPYRITSVYVGGGTPTVLHDGELRQLLSALRNLVPADVEFTVEAGRPDTITSDKLATLERFGVTRVCINPQTLNDNTLECIGRKHSAGEFHTAMQLAQGRFPAVNTDIIVGLPGEDEGDVMHTLEGILAYRPQNITVHALAVKNAAAFAQDRYSVLPSAQQAVRMAAEAESALTDAGYRPYYLYRQKYMSGNLENVGYALPGFESAYNIGNMEEVSSVLAFGAGAISKKLSADRSRIDRAANVKNPLQYVERIDEMIERKTALFCGAE